MDVYQIIQATRVAWQSEGEEIKYHLRELALNICSLLTFGYQLLLYIGMFTFIPDITTDVARTLLPLAVVTSFGAIYQAYEHFSQYDTPNVFFKNNKLNYYGISSFMTLFITVGFLLFQHSILFIQVELVHYALLYFGVVFGIYEMCVSDTSSYIRNRLPSDDGEYKY